MLVNGAEENDEKNYEYVKELWKIGGKASVMDNLVYVDAVCHSELLREFGIQEDEVPTVVYVNSDFEKFTRLIGRIEEKSLAMMSDKIKSNRAVFNKYKSLKFMNKNCSKVHIELREMQNKSSQLDDE